MNRIQEGAGTYERNTDIYERNPDIYEGMLRHMRMEYRKAQARMNGIHIYMKGC